MMKLLALISAVFIFSASSVAQPVAPLSAPADAVAKRYVSLRQSMVDHRALKELVHTVWTARSNLNGKPLKTGLGQLEQLPAMPDNMRLTSVQTFFDNFAIARFDDWASPSAYLITLFKNQNQWRVATEAAANKECVDTSEQYNPDLPVADVLQVLGQYYFAVASDSAEQLAPVHHPGWEMKNHEGPAVVSEGPMPFSLRMSPGKHHGYAGLREIADIQMLYNCMAMVRIDKPSSEVVTVFTFYRTEQGWMIVDKAWSNQNQTP